MCCIVQTLESYGALGIMLNAKQSSTTWKTKEWLSHALMSCPLGLNDDMVKVHMLGINEGPHDKTNKMACAPSEDSD